MAHVPCVLFCVWARLLGKGESSPLAVAEGLEWLMAAVSMICGMYSKDNEHCIFVGDVTIS